MTNTEVTKQQQGTAISTNLINKLMTGIAESRASTVIAGGKPLLRMLKDSSWVYGQRDDVCEMGSLWAINPLALQHGWVCWTNNPGDAKNSLIGEVMGPIHEPKPPRPEPKDGWDFKEQRVLELKCMNGNDSGTEVSYKVSSVGGMRAIDDLLAELQDQLKTDPNHPCPVVRLESDSYQHQKYGKIYTPILEVVGWSDLNGTMAEAVPAPAPLADEENVFAETPPAPPPRQRAAQPAPRVVASQPAPQPQSQPSGARRRPIMR